MRYRIVKEYYDDGTPYYIVQQKRLYWWGWKLPTDESLRKFLFAFTTGGYTYKHFDTFEEAKNAVDMVRDVSEKRKKSNIVEV